MKKYSIPVAWMEHGIMDIEANSVEEAIEKAKDEDYELPEGDYMDDSFEVDVEGAYEFASINEPSKEEKKAYAGDLANMLKLMQDTKGKGLAAMSVYEGRLDAIGYALDLIRRDIDE